jgi:hypothetical protein
MINILPKVTPLTKGLLWFTNGEINRQKPFYKDVDYLLNGLLTATLNSTNSKGPHVLVGENFGNQFFVIVGEIVEEKAIKNYFELIKPQLNGESDLLLIDECNSFSTIRSFAPEEIKSKIHIVQ